MTKQSFLNICFLKALIFINVLFFNINIAFSKSEFQVTDMPDWVIEKPHDIESQSLATIKENPTGIFHLFVDYQTKVDRKNIFYFYRFSKKITSHIGVEKGSHIQVNFTPSQNQIFIHSVKVRRGNQILEKLNVSNIKISQREEKLEQQIYTGGKTLHIFLEDIRVGDILEYSFSIVDKYENLSDRFVYDIYLSKSETLHGFRERLILKKDIEIDIKNHSTHIKPVLKDLGDYKEYVWNILNKPAEDMEEETPLWFEPRPWVEIREKKTWNEIAIEQSRIYTFSEPLSLELKNYIRSVNSIESIDKKFLTVLQFIQNNVRYMGIANFNVGVPTDPSLTFKRRFGDCKDKAVLMVTILNALGIEAYPAFVDSDKGKILNSFLPSPNIFNHVIVVAYIDGKEYWVDPTHAFQRGSLKNLSQPNYGYAFILSKKTNSLTKMKEYPLTSPNEEIYETFDLRGGHESSGLLKVKTVFKKERADDVRERFLVTPKKDLQKEFWEYYQDIYPKILFKKEIVIQDDPVNNQLTIEEEYEIPNPWKMPNDEESWEFSFNFLEFKNYFDRKNLDNRKMPLYIEHPVYKTKKIDILLPKKEWDLSEDTFRIKDSSFIYEKKEYFKNNTFTTFCTYKSLKDHVNLRDMKAFDENIKKFQPAMVIYFPSSERTLDMNKLINWPVVLFLLFLAPLITYFFFKLYRYKIKIPLETNIDLKYQGIKGWLLVITCITIISGLSEFYMFINYLDSVCFLDNWNKMINSAPLNLKYFVKLFAIINVTLKLIFSFAEITSIFLIINKKRLFIKFYLYFLWICLIFAYPVEKIFLLLQNNKENTMSFSLELILVLLFCIIWTAYLINSKRVKATFIND